MICPDIFGQNDYYATDSSTIIDVQLIDNGELLNSRFCQIKRKKTISQYTPYEVKEYGFKNGPVYLSKRIEIADSSKMVFLERLVNGNTTLYYYRGEKIGTYFLEKDSTLFVELPKYERDNKNINFNGFLLDITSDCPEVADATKLVRFSKKSLSKLISRYNKCELKPFPVFKYGLILGYGGNKLIKNDYTNQFDFRYDGGYTFGIFIDNPILVSDFSAHIELYYSRHGFSYNKQAEDLDVDFVANTSTLNLPILIRYTYPSNKIRPFVNTGGYFTYNFKNENAFYEAIINQSTIEIEKVIENSMISKYQVGYSIGGGLEYKLNYKNSLFFELRHNKLFDLSGSGSLNQSELHLFTGINF